MWSFDLGTKSLSDLPKMQKKRSFSTAVLIDDLIYICGGFNPNDGYLKSVERLERFYFKKILCQIYYLYDSTCFRYNPTEGTWSFMAPMLTTRYNHASTTYKRKIYVLGGLQGDDYLNTVEIYDPKLNQWTSGTPMLTPRISFSVNRFFI